MIVGLGVALFVYIFGYLFGWTDHLDVALVDQLFDKRGAKTVHPDIVLIAIDDSSLSRVDQRWPWSPAIHNQLFKKLARRGAHVIAYDYDFSQSRQFLFPGQDEEFAESMRFAGNAVAPARFQQIEKQRNGVKKARNIETVFTSPVDLFDDAVYAVGVANQVPYSDGVIRQFPFQIKFRGEILPPFALAAVGRWLNIHPIDHNQQLLARLGLGGYEPDETYVNFRGPAGSFTTISAHDVLSGAVKPSAIRDKLVMVGVTASDVGLRYDTPYAGADGSRAMSDLEIHANIAATMLEQNYLYKMSPFTHFIFLMVISVFGAMSFVFVRSWLGMLIAAEILVGYFMLALTLFMVANVILPLATIAVSVPIILAGIFVYRKVNTDMEKRKIKGMFSRYTESETVDDLIKAPEIKAVDAKKTKATMLFSDIRGFSEISSQLEPDQVVQLLNKYFDLMTQVLSKYDGTIDRYSGDGIMAVFGLPIPREDDAARAVMAALEMQAVIKNFNALIGMQHRPPLKLGIGINTGEVMVGSVGVDEDSQFTAIGDAVNIASRMESLTKPLDTDVIISETTFQEVQDKFVTNSLGTHQIKGRQQKMRLYQVLFQRRNGNLPV